MRTYSAAARLRRTLVASISSAKTTAVAATTSSAEAEAGRGVAEGQTCLVATLEGLVHQVVLTCLAAELVVVLVLRQPKPRSPPQRRGRCCPLAGRQ